MKKNMQDFSTLVRKHPIVSTITGITGLGLGAAGTVFARKARRMEEEHPVAKEAAKIGTKEAARKAADEMVSGDGKGDGEANGRRARYAAGAVGVAAGLSGIFFAARAYRRKRG
jgi:hypothetical protein